MIEEIFSLNNLFLILICLIWIIVAVIMDFRKREVANWWNFSLVIVVLVYRLLLSFEIGNYWIFLFGIIGLVVGFILANLFYYMRLFAGGDAKLLIGICTILPISLDWMINIRLLVWFLILFLIFGGIYGILYSIILCFVFGRRFVKSFSEFFLKYKYLILGFFIIGLTGILFGIYFKEKYISYLGALVFLSPIFLVYAKAVESSCMIKLVNPRDLTIGEIILYPIKIGKNIIKPNWQGLNDLELELIQKAYKKKVWIRFGIPFTPAFLLGFVGMLAVFWFDFYSLILLRIFNF